LLIGVIALICTAGDAAKGITYWLNPDNSKMSDTVNDKLDLEGDIP
jgi:hypothetical protein